jgi:predicted AAA+ superfamily ATPase
METVWLRGGFPNSLLATDEARSIRWRLDFIRTYLERDIPQFGPRIAAEPLRRFWTMLAHRQGAPLNAAELARSIGVDVKTINRYLDLLADLFLVRRLPAWHANVGKRLVKSPRIYLRDSGLLHGLLDIGSRDDLLAHPVAGASWEGFVVENLLQAAPEGVAGYYYRTSGGAEVDLLLVFPGGEKWVVEVKRGPNPKPERGFYEACGDLEPDRRLIVYPGSERYPLSKDVDAVPLPELCAELQTRRR